MLIYNPKQFEYLVRETLQRVYDELLPAYAAEHHGLADNFPRIDWSGSWEEAPRFEVSGAVVFLGEIPPLSQFADIHEIMHTWAGCRHCHKGLVTDSAAESIIRRISKLLSTALGLGVSETVGRSVLLDGSARRLLPLHSHVVRGEIGDMLRKTTTSLLIFFTNRILASLAPEHWSASCTLTKGVPYVLLFRTFRDLYQESARKAGKELVVDGLLLDAHVLPENPRNPLTPEYRVHLQLPLKNASGEGVPREVTKRFEEAKDRITQASRDFKKENTLCRVRIDFADGRGVKFLDMHRSFTPFIDRGGILWYKDLFSSENPKGISLKGVKTLEILQDMRNPPQASLPWEYRDV